MKRQILLETLLITLIILGGCATPYQRYQGCFSLNLRSGGGYYDRQWKKNVFWVAFSGNGFTSAATVQKYLLRRCCEITLDHGYDYFTISKYKPTSVTRSCRLRKPYTETKGQFTRGMFGELKYSAKTRYHPGINIPVTFHTVSAFIICGKQDSTFQTPANAFDAKELLQYLRTWP